MARIFISHSSRDNARAQDLLTWLRARGFEEGFLDIDKDQGIPPGERWEQKLYDELERAQAVVLLLTKNWFDSKWCFAEFAQARSRGKAIFPVVVTPDGDQFVGDDLQKLDLTKDRQGGLEQLADSLTKVALLSQGGFDLPPGRAPYPGFLSFDEDDAAVYFGRDDDIRRLIQRLDSRRIEGGRRFILVLGESGTGKSSLIRAGLIPRLKRAKREWVALSAFRPESDPFAGLALCLEEAGFKTTAAELPDCDPAAIATAIGTANDARRAGILIAIDQMEELFTRTPPQRREQFLAFLSRLLGHDLPFVAVATLRSDHLGNMQTAAGLTVEFEDFALRPLPVERISEIIRGPARIAGLEVESEFIARITADARTTDALPLVAFALRRLYDTFATDGKIQLVEYESLRDAAAGLSPLDTIVRETAARVIADEKPSDDELKALREAFVPGLVRINDEGGFVRQAARWDSLPEASRRLITALAGPKARLLVLRDRDGSREVEVAHEALFRVWPLLAGWLEEEKEFLIGHNRLERALSDWRSLPRDDCDKGLVTGILLDRARNWLIAHPARFSEQEAAFIRASDAAEIERKRQDEEQRRALEAAKLRQTEIERDAARRLTRRTRIAAAAFAVIALVAVGAGVRALQAEQHAHAMAEQASLSSEKAQTAAKRATRNFDIAKSSVDDMIFDFAQGLRDVEGMRIETIRGILSSIESAMQRLSDAAPENTSLQRSRMVMLNQFGDTYMAAGDGHAALTAYSEGLTIARRLATIDPNNTEPQRDLTVSLNLIGNVKLQTGDAAAALAAYQESLDIRRRLAKLEPDNTDRQLDLSVSLVNIGDVKLRSGDAAAALAAYQESLAIRRRLADANPNDSELQREVSVNLDRIGGMKLDSGDSAAALAAYQESLDISRELANANSGNSARQSDLAIDLDNIAYARQRTGDAAGALAAYNESLAIRRRLVSADPSNTGRQRDLTFSLNRIGDFKFSAGDTTAALAAYQESLDIRRRLANKDPANANWQRDLSVSLDNVSDVKLAAGDRVSALAGYEESLGILRQLAKLEPDNTAWQRDISISLNKIGDTKRRTGDWASALSSYEEALTIRRQLATAAPDNMGWQRDISVSFERIGDIKLDSGDTAAALDNYEKSLAIRRRLGAMDPNNIEWQRDIAFSLNEIGDVKDETGDAEAALAAYQQSLDIRRRLAKADPANADWQRDLSSSLVKIADLKLDAGDTDAALAAYQESLDIRRSLVETSPDNAGWQRDLSLVLERIGDVKRDAGDTDAAVAAYEECLSIRRRLVKTDPGNTGWQRDLSIILNRIGDTRLDANDSAAAFAAYQEGLTIRRRLVAANPDNVQWQTDVAMSLWKIQGSTDNVEQRRRLLSEAADILDRLDSTGQLDSDHKNLPSLVHKALAGLE